MHEENSGVEQVRGLSGSHLISIEYSCMVYIFYAKIVFIHTSAFALEAPRWSRPVMYVEGIQKNYHICGVEIRHIRLNAQYSICTQTQMTKRNGIRTYRVLCDIAAHSVKYQRSMINNPQTFIEEFGMIGAFHTREFIHTRVT